MAKQKKTSRVGFFRDVFKVIEAYGPAEGVEVIVAQLMYVAAELVENHAPSPEEGDAFLREALEFVIKEMGDNK